MLIGASTGGPAHIEKILNALFEPLNFTLIIAQHMDSKFLPGFVKQLASRTSHSILLSQENQTIVKGNVYIATNYCSLYKNGDDIKFHVKEFLDARFNPDINHLFSSALPLKKNNKLLAIILTGIGDDGVKGCELLTENGVECIAESEKTAKVYGMPARAKERVANIKVLDLNEIIQAIQTFGES